MVHGANFPAIQGMLERGLMVGRAFCMFNMIPHFDKRAGVGQRFDDGNSLVYVNPHAALSG